MREVLYALPYVAIGVLALAGFVVFVAFVISMVKKTWRRRQVPSAS